MHIEPIEARIVSDGMSGNLTLVIISARGQAARPAGAKGDVAIKSLTVGGRVELAQVLAGFTTNETPANGNASVGAVRVGGDWIASSISAGVEDTSDDGDDDDDDALIATPAPDAIIARIASVVIKGAVIGAPSPFFECGFVAQQIGSFKAGFFTAPLTAATDAFIVLTPYTANETIREV